MHYQIELRNSQSIHTAVIRSRVRSKELPQFVPAACGEVWSFIRSTGLPRPGRHLALYLDAEGSVEVGAEVSEPFTGNDRSSLFPVARRPCGDCHPLWPLRTPFRGACSYPRVVR